MIIQRSMISLYSIADHIDLKISSLFINYLYYNMEKSERMMITSIQMSL